MTEHIDRPKFREIRYKEHMGIPDRYDVVESKMDGIWGCLYLRGDTIVCIPEQER